MNVSMLLNTAIFTAVVTEAKTKAANSPAWLRAIERAVVELNRAAYWSFVDGVLVLISTTSKKRYVIDAAHTCEARNGICKHRAAHRLMTRYVAALANVPVATEQQPSAPAQVQVVVSTPALTVARVCQLCQQPLNNRELQVHTKCALYRRAPRTNLSHSAATAATSPKPNAVAAPRRTPVADGVLWHRTITGEKYNGIDF